MVFYWLPLKYRVMKPESPKVSIASELPVTSPGGPSVLAHGIVEEIAPLKHPFNIPASHVGLDLQTVEGFLNVGSPSEARIRQSVINVADLFTRARVELDCSRLEISRLLKGREAFERSQLRDPAIPLASLQSKGPTEAKHALEICDLHVEKVVKRKEMREILRALSRIQERCEVSVDGKFSGSPEKGIWFADPVKELKNVLGVPGAELLVLRDKNEYIWGMYIYHTGGRKFANQDEKLVEVGRNYRFSDGAPLLKKGEKLGVAHVCCIDPRIEEVFGVDRYLLYLTLHVCGLEECARKGVDVLVATCRLSPAPNPVLKGAHTDVGWWLLPDRFIEKPDYIPQFGQSTLVQSGVLALSVQSQYQQGLAALIRRIKAANFVDLDLSDGIRQPL